MKKLILTIIALSIITLNGCYDPDTATVRINLGNIPIAKHEPKSFIDRVLGLFEKEAYADPLSSLVNVDKVHIAAVSNNTVIASASIDADDIDATDMGNYRESYIEFNAPAGENIIIIVIGEYTPPTGGLRFLSHFGYTPSPLNLSPGETTNAQITMSTGFFSSFGFNIDDSALPYSITWQKIPGAVVVITGEFEGEIYRGTGTQAYYTNGNQTLSWHAEFPFANISSTEDYTLVN